MENRRDDERFDDEKQFPPHPQRMKENGCSVTLLVEVLVSSTQSKKELRRGEPVRPRVLAGLAVNRTATLSRNGSAEKYVCDCSPDGNDGPGASDAHQRED